MQGRRLTALCMLLRVCNMEHFLVETLGEDSDIMSRNSEAGVNYNEDNEYDPNNGDYAKQTGRFRQSNKKSIVTIVDCQSNATEIWLTE